MFPVKSLCCKYSCRRLLIWNNSGGGSPVKELFCKWRWVRFCNDPSGGIFPDNALPLSMQRWSEDRDATCEGIGPVSSLNWRYRLFKLVITDSSGGIALESLFRCSPSSSRLDSLCKLVGIVPVRVLLLKERNRKLVAVPNSEGIVAESRLLSSQSPSSWVNKPISFGIEPTNPLLAGTRR